MFNAVNFRFTVAVFCNPVLQLIRVSQIKTNSTTCVRLSIYRDPRQRSIARWTASPNASQRQSDKTRLSPRASWRNRSKRIRPPNIVIALRTRVLCDQPSWLQRQPCPRGILLRPFAAEIARWHRDGSVSPGSLPPPQNQDR